MADERMKPGAMDMPFDGKRMFWGGFTADRRPGPLTWPAARSGTS
jgi:hypothetical protein